jgi:MFS family permease
VTAAPLPPPDAGSSPDSYAVLRYPAYRWYIASTFSATLAMQIQAVVTAWLVYALTHDALALGLIGLAEALPAISVALFAGHVADRMDRRRIALVTLAVLVGCSASLLTISVHLAAHAGHPVRHAVFPIYGVIMVSGVARSFLQPSRSALSAELVPRELYERAAAWRSSAWQLAAVGGPALGGLLYGFGSARLAYTVDASLVVVSLVCMWRVRRPVRHTTAAHTHSLRESLATGARFLRGQPVVLGALSLDLFSVLFGGATALLPIYASEILHVGPKGLGLLQAAPAAGAVTMSLFLAHSPPMRRAGRSLFISVAVFGLATIGFALSRSFGLSLAMLAISGMADTESVVIRSTLLQIFTPVDLLGRVSSVNQIFIGSSNEIGAFESGVTAKLMGAVGSVILGGTMTLVVVALTAWRVPALRRLRTLRPDEAEPELAHEVEVAHG